MPDALINALPFLILGGLMYALLIRPQQQRTKAHQRLLESVGEGDEIISNAGIYGFVNAVEDDVLWVEIANGVEVRLTKSAVASKVAVDESEDEDS